MIVSKIFAHKKKNIKKQKNNKTKKNVIKPFLNCGGSKEASEKKSVNNDAFGPLPFTNISSDSS